MKTGNKILKKAEEKMRNSKQKNCHEPIKGEIETVAEERERIKKTITDFLDLAAEIENLPSYDTMQDVAMICARHGIPDTFIWKFW